MRTAAIDCGTNSIRLLIADIDDGAGLTDVVRLMRVVRLGQGVDATGRLAEEALARTFEAAGEYADLIAEHGAERVRFVATSATRDAANREVFVEGIRDRLGVEPEIVSGREEAALSFSGAASVLDLGAEDRVLVVDLGGGSTEFVVGTADGVAAARSMNMGCVRFTERYLVSDPPTSGEIGRALTDIHAMIADVQQDVPFTGVNRLVGVAGSITTVAAHALRLPQYDAAAINGTELAASDIEGAAEDLLSMTRAERAALPYMHPGRVDVIGAGALIWRTIVGELGRVTDGAVHSATASEHDILDGIALHAARR